MAWINTPITFLVQVRFPWSFSPIRDPQGIQQEFLFSRPLSAATLPIKDGAENWESLLHLSSTTRPPSCTKTAKTERQRKASIAKIGDQASLVLFKCGLAKQEVLLSLQAMTTSEDQRSTFGLAKTRQKHRQCHLGNLRMSPPPLKGFWGLLGLPGKFLCVYFLVCVFNHLTGMAASRHCHHLFCRKATEWWYPFLFGNCQSWQGSAVT